METEQRTRRFSKREPADWLRDKSNVIGGWLLSLTFAFGVGILTRMIIPISNQPEHRRACNEAVETARRILSGELGIVAGSRRFARLRFDVRAENDPDFLFFVGVDSETDHLPVGEVRRHWSSDASRAKDWELRDFEESVRDVAFRVCRSLIQRYETYVAEPSAPGNAG